VVLVKQCNYSAFRLIPISIFAFKHPFYLDRVALCSWIDQHRRWQLFKYLDLKERAVTGMYIAHGTDKYMFVTRSEVEGSVRTKSVIDVKAVVSMFFLGRQFLAKGALIDHLRDLRVLVPLEASHRQLDADRQVGYGPALKPSG
jgi:hypothetical protein